MTTPTTEVYYFAECVKAVAKAKEEMLEAEREVEKSRLKLIKIREAENEAKLEFYNAEQDLPYAIENIDSSIDTTTLAETLMSWLYNKKETESKFSKAEEKKKEASEEYDKAIYNNEVATKNYSDAKYKMELAWKAAEDSVQLK
jgi:hypothetical protein